MRKKRKTIILVTMSLVLAGTVIGLILLLKHEPTFYRRADMPPGKDRKDRSTAFCTQFSSLINNWVDGPAKGEWTVTFAEAQLNSYFTEDSIPHGLAEALRLQGITDPRVVMDDGKLRLAFRYGSPPWSTILSYDLRLWLAPKDVNVVCVEIVGRHAGALPIATQSLLNDIAEVAGRHGIEVTWYRQKGNPVALVRFQADRSRPPAQLRRLDVKQGLITIGGVSQEPLMTHNERRNLTPSAN
jgi:hypothetical protein